MTSNVTQGVPKEHPEDTWESWVRELNRREKEYVERTRKKDHVE